LTSIQHINHPLVARPHTPIYLTHKFWGRKPHNVVGQYIETYSKPNEVVLDSFIGSGVTAIEAIRLGRKTIAVDLNPVSILITRMTLMPVELKNFERAFKSIERNVKTAIMKFYETKCPKCGGDFMLEIKDGEVIMITHSHSHDR